MNPHKIGETITGTCVTIGNTVTGRVTRVVWPAPFTGTDQPRYWITDAEGHARVVESGWVDHRVAAEARIAARAS